MQPSETGIQSQKPDASKAMFQEKDLTLRIEITDQSNKFNGNYLNVDNQSIVLDEDADPILLLTLNVFRDTVRQSIQEGDLFKDKILSSIVSFVNSALPLQKGTNSKDMDETVQLGNLLRGRRDIIVSLGSLIRAKKGSVGARVLLAAYLLEAFKRSERTGDKNKQLTGTISLIGSEGTLGLKYTADNQVTVFSHEQFAGN